MQTTVDDDATPLILEDNPYVRYKTAQQRKRCVVISLLSLIVIVAVIIIIIVVVIDSDESESTIDWGMKFIELPSNETARNNSKYLTEFPHLAGSPQNYQYAEYLQNKLQSFGFNASLRQYENIYLGGYIYSSLKQLNSSNPLQSEIITEFNLAEDIVESDPTSNVTERTQAYNSYSASGNVTGPLIYVNYGSRKDFLTLTNLGYNLSEMIGIVKYGGGMFRGEKSLEAQTFQMIGLLLYSDPLDYGSFQGDIYPNGPWLPSGGYQRGSIIAGYYCPGNPSQQRLLQKCNKTKDKFMPQIPVIPIGYRNAYILMSQLNGMVVNINTEWQGGFNFSYQIGGRFDNDSSMNVIVNLDVINDNENTVTITDVVGYIKGTKYPNEAILIGNHYDAWIMGAADPISGTVASLEIARSLGELIQMGWEPLRSIYIAYWDAEEQALIGSTAFGEENAEMLQNDLIVYMNIDVAVSGSNIYTRSDPTLSKFMIDTLQYINKPHAYEDNINLNLYQDWITRQPVNRSLQSLPIGYGSDYVVFVEHLGLPAMDTGFEGQFGTYHSVYDSYSWMSQIIDPQYQFHVVLAQYFGLLAVNLLTNDILPYNITNLYVVMHEWLDNEILYLINDNNCDNSPDSVLQNVTRILQQEIDEFGNIAMELDGEVDELRDREGRDKGNEEFDNDVIKYNQLFRGLYQQFLYEPGLPNRFYFKNTLIAPDIDSGYQPQVFPHLAYALKYTQCNDVNIREAYTVTTNVLRNAKIYLQN